MTFTCKISFVLVQWSFAISQNVLCFEIKSYHIEDVFVELLTCIHYSYQLYWYMYCKNLYHVYCCILLFVCLYYHHLAVLLRVNNPRDTTPFDVFCCMRKYKCKTRGLQLQATVKRFLFRLHLDLESQYTLISLKFQRVTTLNRKDQ